MIVNALGNLTNGPSTYNDHFLEIPHYCYYSDRRRITNAKPLDKHPKLRLRRLINEFKERDMLTNYQSPTIHNPP